MTADLKEDATTMADTTADLLVELGTEELPPGALSRLSEAFTQGLHAALTEARLAPGTAEGFAAPRRLAVRIADVQGCQASESRERRGPAVEVAFDDEGNPTPAAQGFARSCGCEVADLATLETDKGRWLVHRHTEEGQSLQAILPGLLESVLGQLPVPRRMRWGSGSAEFVRPVHWLLIRYGSKVLPAHVLGLDSGGTSRGHRFHSPDPVEIPSAGDYESLLESAHVIPDFSRRRAIVRDQTHVAAASLGGEPLIDPDLLDEVTAMVEWPVAVPGRFEERFLSIPDEALMSSMQGHQKYFPVVDDKGALMAAFVTIANIDSREPAQVRAGNERVIRPRLADTEFFWNLDRKHSLESRIPRLDRITFQRQLGTVGDKVARLRRLVGQSASGLVADTTQVERAAALCKCDLVSEMVGEFPELQGIMGREYARHDGEADAVAIAIAEHYQPRFAGDALPAVIEGRLLALADRLDTIVGLFGIGQPPTGSKDPYALRRAALGVLRILIEGELDLDLRSLITHARSAYAEQSGVTELQSDAEEAAFSFIMERLRVYYQDRGVQHDVFEAVRAVDAARPLDFHHRIQAVRDFSGHPAAAALIAANKRIVNLLQQAPDELDAEPMVDPTLFEHAAEGELHALLHDRLAHLTRAAGAGEYAAVLAGLAELQAPIDAFFDAVMVMADDAPVRRNRLGLLSALRQAFLLVADPSRLTHPGEASS